MGSTLSSQDILSMMTAEEMNTEPKLVQSVKPTSCVEVTSFPADVILRRVW